METREMPKYKCYKEVHALKIERIVFDAHEAEKEGRETDGSAILNFGKKYDKIKVDSNYISKIKEGDDLGYYVVYQDGYKSWSPTIAFEEGYNLIK